MKKRKILWITDDQINHRNIYVEHWKEVGELILTNKFIVKDNIDFVIVDYGFLDKIENVNILKEYHLNKIPIVWSGGFGGTDRYSEDSKKVFPNEKWLHNIESISLSNLMWYVDNYFEKARQITSASPTSKKEGMELSPLGSIDFWAGGQK